MTDLTERLQSAEQLRLAAAVFEQSAEGIVILDATHNVLMVNQAYTKMTGYSAAELIGKLPPVMDPGCNDASFIRAMWETVDRAIAYADVVDPSRKWFTFNGL